MSKYCNCETCDDCLSHAAWQRRREACAAIAAALGRERCDIRDGADSWYVHYTFAQEPVTIRVSNHRQPSGGSRRVKAVGGFEFATRTDGEFALDVRIASASDQIPSRATIRGAVARQVRQDRAALAAQVPHLRAAAAATKEYFRFLDVFSLR